VIVVNNPPASPPLPSPEGHLGKAMTGVVLGCRALMRWSPAQFEPGLERWLERRMRRHAGAGTMWKLVAAHAMAADVRWMRGLN